MAALTPKDILSFWFDEIETKAWYRSDAKFDELLRERFGQTLMQAAAGELSGWRTDPRGRLAEIIVLDQFSRNIHRGTPQAFSQDPMALVLSQEAVVAKAHVTLSTNAERSFLLMPYMHSESRVIHALADELFKEHAAGNYEYEVKHKAIVDRFGRYPHRNEVLGRESTPEELEFLKQPGSGF